MLLVSLLRFKRFKYFNLSNRELDLKLFSSNHLRASFDVPPNYKSSSN